MNKEQEMAMEEMKAAKEELEELRDEVNAGIETLKQTAKESAVTVVVRSIVAACAYGAMDKLAGVFLPKNLRGIAKVGAAAGSFLIPEIIANAAATKVEEILQEDN